MQLVHEYLGIPLTSQKIVPGDTATGIGANIYQYKEHQVNYDSGDYAFLAGDVIVGATSGAVGVVISCTVNDGTTVAGGDAAGTIRFKSNVSGSSANFTNNEKIKVGADTDVGDIDGSVSECTDNYTFKNMYASRALVSVRAQTALICMDGSTPDQTRLQGHDMAAGNSYVLHGLDEIKNFKVIDYASGSASTVSITCYF